MAIKRCKSSFAVAVDGAPRIIRVGTLVKDGDPVLKGREQHFEDVDTYMSRRRPAVEEATAEPGKLRALTPPRTRQESPPSAPFDPNEHKNDEVLAYLGTATEAETLRVLDLEAVGQNRSGILKGRDKLLADARTRDEEGNAS